MNKGVVMEWNEKYLIVMTPAGTFDRIPNLNRTCVVGEEIMYAPRQAGQRNSTLAVMGIFVAAVMFCMVLFTGIPAVFADKSIVAYISIDINPSVELGIDKNKKVREIRGLNEKGLDLVHNLSYSGRSLDDVTSKLLQKAEEMNVFASGEGDVVIASAAVKEDSSINDTVLAEELKQQVLAHVVTKHPDEAAKIEVTAFVAPVEAIASAQENGLSLGKYSVYLNAKDKGYDLKVEDLKKDSVHNIANVAGGISKLVDTTKLEKTAIKELIAEEKDGRLDKKVQDKKNAAKPSQKPTATPKSSAKAAPTPKASTTNKAPDSGKSPSSTPPGKNNTAGGKATDTNKIDDKNDDKNNPGKNPGKNDDKINDKNNDKSNDKNDGKNNDKNDDKNTEKNPGKNDNKSNDKNDDKNNGKEADKNTVGKATPPPAPTPKNSTKKND